MGQAEVKFETAEALDGSGQPVSISNAIDDVTPEQFYEMTENYIMKRKVNAKGYETSYKVEKMEDGSLHQESTMATSGAALMLWGEMSGTIHVKLKIDRDEGLITTETFGEDGEMKPESLLACTYLKVHEDPFRLEHYQETMQSRNHGKMLKALLVNSMQKAGIDVEISSDHPSPTQEGQKSVLSGPLPGMTMEKLFKIHHDQSMEENGTELPGGGVLMEKEWVISSTYHTVCMSEDGKTILHKGFGNDDTLTDLASTIHEQLTSEDPPRIETWSMMEYRRLPMPAMTEEFVKRVFAFAQGKEEDAEA